MRKYLILFVFIIICSFIIDQVTHNVYSNNPGAVLGKTGSPDDGQTCSDGVGCHGGIPTPLSNIITSDVPIGGFIPDSTYTITMTVSSPTRVEFGFEISPQDSNGNLIGSLFITDPIRTHFCAGVGGTKYITHTLAGTNAPSHTSIWQFNWKAPSSSVGCVTFWGAFNYANSNNLSTGDSIHTSTLTICENGVGINDPLVLTSFSAYPNPLNNYLELTYYLQKPEIVEINLLDATGSLMMRLFNQEQSGGAQNFSLNLDQEISAGIYLLQLKAGKETIVKKVVKL